MKKRGVMPCLGIDDWDVMFAERQRAITRLFSCATRSLAEAIEILKSGERLPRDIFDPYADRMKLALKPFRKDEFSCWSYYKRDRPPVFSGTSDEVLTWERRNNARRERMLLKFTDRWDEFCCIGQERFPAVADKFEILRQIARKRLDQRDGDADIGIFRTDSEAVFKTLSEIAVGTINAILCTRENLVAITKGGKRVRHRGVSCHLGRTIRKLSVLKDGQTFKVDGSVYRITAKKTIELLDRLIDAYEYDNRPVPMDMPLAAYFNRGDALAFRKKYIRCADRKAALSI